VQASAYAADAGVTTFVDMGSGAVNALHGRLLPLLRGVDYVLMNEQELFSLTGEASISDAVAGLRAQGIQQLVVKVGEMGSIVVTPELTELVEALDVDDVVDTTGAGDYYTAAFAHGVMSGADLLAAAWLGNVAGALNTTRVGAQSFPLDLATLERHARSRGVRASLMRALLLVALLALAVASPRPRSRRASTSPGGSWPNATGTSTRWPSTGTRRASATAPLARDADDDAFYDAARGDVRTHRRRPHRLRPTERWRSSASASATSPASACSVAGAGDATPTAPRRPAGPVAALRADRVRACSARHRLRAARRPGATRHGPGVRSRHRRPLGARAESFVLDLRGNPGGRLITMMQVAGVFTGGFLWRAMTTWSLPLPYPALGVTLTDAPLAVLVDGDVHSAAEGLAGALQLRGRALVVGATTAGNVEACCRSASATAPRPGSPPACWRPSAGPPGRVRGVTPDLATDLERRPRAPPWRPSPTARERGRTTASRPSPTACCAYRSARSHAAAVHPHQRLRGGRRRRRHRGRPGREATRRRSRARAALAARRREPQGRAADAHAPRPRGRRGRGCVPLWPDLQVWAPAGELGRCDPRGGAMGVRHGRNLTLGGAVLTLVGTPGHALDHVAVWWSEARRLLLAGDLVAGEGSIWVGLPDGDVSAYLASLERAAALAPPVVAPAHGPVRRDGAAVLHEARRHRLAREAACSSALRTDPAR
jgi:glyoxylase-like metal-dependent hydrolase (beta-lactamase superfamily II)